VIRIDDQQYWLYAAVDPETNYLLHTQVETMINNTLADRFSLISEINTIPTTQRFLLMDRPQFNEPVANMTSISDTNDMEIGTALNVSFVK